MPRQFTKKRQFDFGSRDVVRELGSGSTNVQVVCGTSADGSYIHQSPSFRPVIIEVRFVAYFPVLVENPRCQTEFLRQRSIHTEFVGPAFAFVVDINLGGSFGALDYAGVPG